MIIMQKKFFLQYEISVFSFAYEFSGKCIFPLPGGCASDRAFGLSLFPVELVCISE